MENLDLKVPLKARELWAKTKEIFKKRSKMFWTILLLFAVPVAAVEAYLNYNSYAAVSQLLWQLDFSSTDSATALAETLLNAPFSIADSILTALGSIFQVLSLLLMVLLAYGYLLGGKTAKLGILDLIKVSLRNIFWAFMFFMFYSYLSQLIIGLVSNEMAAIWMVGASTKIGLVEIVSIVMAIVTGIASALFLYTFCTLYFFPMIICTATGRTRAILSLPYIRAVLHGQVKKAFLQLLPWVLLIGGATIAFLLPGIYFAGSNATISLAIFGVGSFFTSILQSLLLIFMTAQFFNLEANSKAIIRLQMEKNEQPKDKDKQ